MKPIAIIVAAALLAGCVNRPPPGQRLVSYYAQSEAAALTDKKSWTAHYRDSYQAISKLTPQPRVALLREHLMEMQAYSMAMDDGKITKDEFTLLRVRQEDALLQRLKSEPPLIATTPTETAPPATSATFAEVFGAALGIGLGVAAAYSLTAPAPRQQVVCTTGRPVGNTVQTICR